jgi:hypothetical protein
MAEFKTDVERDRDRTLYYMSLAVAVRNNANCWGSEVGAVLVRNDRVISTGYNGTPARFLNCREPRGQAPAVSPRACLSRPRGRRPLRRANGSQRECCWAGERPAEQAVRSPRSHSRAAPGAASYRGPTGDWITYTGHAGVVTAFLSDSEATRSGHETPGFAPEHVAIAIRIPAGAVAS